MRGVAVQTEDHVHTKDFLAAELRKAGLHVMADRAATGYYHDFLSPLDTPCLQLYVDLTATGTPEAMALRERHANGEFDSSEEESAEWLASPEGQETLSKLTPSLRKALTGEK